jgi:hypothetical protein
MLAAASKMRGSNSSPVSTFILQISLLIKPHEKKSNASEKRQGLIVHARFKELYLGNHTHTFI